MKRRWIIDGVLIAAALSLRIAAGQSASLSYVVLACFALLGRTQAIQALTLTWLFNMLSS